jgi:hypothetical protein
MSRAILPATATGFMTDVNQIPTDGAGPAPSSQLVALAVGLAYSQLSFEQGVHQLSLAGDGPALDAAGRHLHGWGQLPHDIRTRAGVLLSTASQSDPGPNFPVGPDHGQRR